MRQHNIHGYIHRMVEVWYPHMDIHGYPYPRQACLLLLHRIRRTTSEACNLKCCCYLANENEKLRLLATRIPRLAVDMDIHGYIHGYIHVWISDFSHPVDISMNIVLSHLLIKLNILVFYLNIIFFCLSFLLFIFSFIHVIESNE